MPYAILILGLQAVILLALVVVVVRFIGRLRRAGPEARGALLTPRALIRPVLHLCGLLVVTVSILYTGLRTRMAIDTDQDVRREVYDLAGSFLKRHYGAPQSGLWMSIRDETRLFEFRNTGYYVVAYDYAGHSGEITCSYRKHDGKPVFEYKLIEDKQAVPAVRER
jgi:hypothetical protein